MALETASSLYGQEGQPLPLLAIKLNIVITNNDVSVPKVGLICNRTDTYGKIYNHSRRPAMAIYIATQLGSVVNFTGGYDGNWFRGELGASVGRSFFAA